MLLLLTVLVVLFSGLGIWQMQRLAWKRELITMVDARIQAEPLRISAPDDWTSLDTQKMVYQRVYLTGFLDHAAEVQSLAVSELGSGYWVMTPMQLVGGGTVLINRGFVPQSMREPTTRPTPPPTGKVTIHGLIRASEPAGGFLRDNNPEAGRWYSRDVGAIAQAKDLAGPVAPFFIDAAARIDPAIAGSIDEFPLGGLTVVNFRNTHLSYALTWFALAVLSVVGVVLLLKEWRKQGPTGQQPTS